MIAYITKHALTKGILTIRATRDGESVGIQNLDNMREWFFGEGREWHRTWEDAERHAQAMRDDKVASLNKQLDKLLALTFTPPE